MLMRIAIFSVAVAALAALGQIPVAATAEAESNIIEIAVPEADLAACQATLQAVLGGTDVDGAPLGDASLPTARCIVADETDA